LKRTRNQTLEELLKGKESVRENGLFANENRMRAPNCFKGLGTLWASLRPNEFGQPLKHKAEK